MASPGEPDKHSSLQLLKHDATANAPEVEQAGLELDRDAMAPQVGPQRAYSELDHEKFSPIETDASAGKEVINNDSAARKSRLSKKRFWILGFLICAIVAIAAGLGVGLTRHQTNQSPAPIASSATPATISANPVSTSTTPSTSTTASSATTSSASSQPTTDGVYLVNGSNGKNNLSGLAYYNNIEPGKNDNHPPDDYTNVTVGVYRYWEGSTTGEFNSSGVVFTAMLGAGSASAALGTVAGNATNGYRNFIVYKDDGRVLYQLAGGWMFRTIYYCD